MGLISSVNLDMYLPEDTLSGMSEAEKGAARQRIDNWLHLMKSGIAAPFPTIIEILDKKVPTRRPRKTVETTPASTIIRRSQRLESSCSENQRSALHDNEPTPSAMKQPIVVPVALKCVSVNTLDSTPSCSGAARQADNFVSLSLCAKENFLSVSSTPSHTDSQSKRRSVSPPQSISKKVATATNEAEIPQHLRNFMKSTTLDNTEKSLIKSALLNAALHKYEINPMLNGKRGLDKILQHLERGGVIFQKNLSDVCDELLQHISKRPLNILAINPDMREGLAISFVATYPQMAQKPVRNGDMPWTWLFDRANNTGKLAAVYRKLQQKQQHRPRGGGTERRKMKQKPASASQPAATSVDELQLSNNTKLLRLLSPVDSSKDEITQLMAETFPERKALVSNGNYQVGVLLQAYVHLKSFQGEMIDQDFDLWYPGKKNNLLANFQNLIPFLMEAATRDKKKFPPEEVLKFKDESLNALMILSKFLPKPKRTHEFEKNMSPIAEISDIFQIVPVGSNITYEVTIRKESAQHPVQPYLIGVGSYKEIGRIYLVWGDAHSMELPRNCMPLRAIDFLVKAHFVLCTPYILGWKYALRFLQVHCYSIPPDNPRETVFTDKLMELKTFTSNSNEFRNSFDSD